MPTICIVDIGSRLVGGGTGATRCSSGPAYSLRSAAYNRSVIEPAIIDKAIAELGEPKYRARQVYEALTRGLETDFAAMTTLPQRLREALATRLRAVSLEEVETRRSRRGDARKTLFVTADGHPVEAVLMTYAASGHGVRLEPGRVCRRVSLLRLRTPWAASRPDRRGDRRPGPRRRRAPCGRSSGT